MSTKVLGEHDELTDWLRRRRELGQDRYDEMWAGEYHVAPYATSGHGFVVVEILLALAGPARAADLYGTDGFNLGTKHDYRVPDAGWHAAIPGGLYLPTAFAVLEVLSPDDETWAKFDFYRAHGVREILVAHPTERWVHCWQLQRAGDRPVSRSEVFGVSMTELAGDVRWPG